MQTKQIQVKLKKYTPRTNISDVKFTVPTSLSKILDERKYKLEMVCHNDMEHSIYVVSDQNEDVTSVTFLPNDDNIKSAVKKIFMVLMENTQ